MYIPPRVFRQRDQNHKILCQCILFVSRRGVIAATQLVNGVDKSAHMLGLREL